MARKNAVNEATEAIPARKRTLSLLKYSGAAPSEGARFQVNVLHNIVDRWEGTSMTYPVWGDKPSVQYITERLVDSDTRERVAAFFLRREIASVLQNALPIRTLRVGDETHLTKSQLFEAILNQADMSESAAGVILDLILPPLMDCELVSRNFKYSVHTRYPFRRVTVDDLKLDVAMYQVVQAAQAAKLTNVVMKTKQNIRVLAEAVAESFRPVGLTLLDLSDLSRVIDDIVRGVRAKLDPLQEGGKLIGDVPTDWRNHRVIDELSQNLVFVRAALAMPPGSSLTLACEGWKLEKWAPVVLAAIKSSARYAWVGKAEALRHYSLRKVRDVKGKVMSCVLNRSIKAQPIAQSVFAFEDSVTTGAYEINATKDRISEVVQSAYGKADFSTDLGALTLHSALVDMVEAGWTAVKPVYTIDAEGSGTDPVDIAILMSRVMYVRMTEDGIELDDVSTGLAQSGVVADWERVWNPRWWFVIPTKEQNMDVWSGSHLGSEVVTADPAEVLLAAEEFEAVEAYPARPQVLGPDAFNARVVNFDADVLQSVQQKLKFDANINGVVLSGALRAIDCASLRSAVHTHLVKPHFNAEVVGGLAAALELLRDVLNDLSKAKDEGAWLSNPPDDMFFEFAKRRLSRSVLLIAQKLSPAFRAEIHTTIIERTIAIAGLSVDESMLMRARLNQKTYAAFADVIALYFFLHLQAFDAERWQALTEVDDLVKTCLEMGSDR